jgi:GDP-L-fucose synthase
MDKNDKIVIAGHTGLVGSALVRALRNQGYQHLITATHAEVDLTDSVAVQHFIAQHRPDYVFLAAAKVGGIWANNTFPADFIEQNLTIQNNVIRQAKDHDVKRLLFLGSSCIYPRDCPQPIKEEYLLSGPLETTNRPYALAKIAGIEMCWAFNRQYGTKYLAVMPTNLFGPGDNYDLNTSHVIPALIRKMHEAKLQNFPEVEVWGTGTPRREFLYSDDLADACVFLMNLEEPAFEALVRSDQVVPMINIGCGQDLTIAELAQLIAKNIGYEGNIRFNPSKPDGTPRKMLCVDKMSKLGWQASISLQEGIQKAYHHFQNQTTTIAEPV